MQPQEYAGLRMACDAGKRHATSPSPPAPSGSSQAPIGPRFPYSYTKRDVDAAVAKAITQERARISTVFGADASHGRERVCATLLASPKGFTAAAILAELPRLPTDKDHAAQRAAKQQRTVGEIWDRAMDVASGQNAGGG